MTGLLCVFPLFPSHFVTSLKSAIRICDITAATEDSFSRRRSLCDDSGSWAHKKKSPPVLFEVAPPHTPPTPLPTTPTPTRCVLYLTDSDGGKTEEGEARGAASGINRLFTPAVCLTLSRSAILYLPPLSCYHIRTAGFFFFISTSAIVSLLLVSLDFYFFFIKKEKKINNKKKNTTKTLRHLIRPLSPDSD